ncbi:MAG: DUF6273 domain-containing protein [Clostridiales bacterium]|jgi:hypothetical protein|nr:DUF6273 domain-containing protein [Clostridiales bacterium]
MDNKNNITTTEDFKFITLVAGGVMSTIATIGVIVALAKESIPGLIATIVVLLIGISLLVANFYKKHRSKKTSTSDVVAVQEPDSTPAEASKTANDAASDIVKPVLEPDKDIYGHNRTVYTFGRHPTNKAGTDKDTKIRWICLKEENGKGLFVSEQILACKPYHNTIEDWKTLKKDNDKFYQNEASCRKFWTQSDLCKWLNNGFYKKAFKDGEQRNIIEKSEIGSKVFLLSIDEAREAFGAKQKGTWGFYEKELTGYKGLENYTITPLAQATGTPYANNQGLYPDAGIYKEQKVTEYFGKSWYWLRSPSSSVGCAAFVDDYGCVSSVGIYVYGVDFADDGVRPALWLNL